MSKGGSITISAILLSISISLAGCVNQADTNKKQATTNLAEMTETANATVKSISPGSMATDPSEESSGPKEADIKNESTKAVSADETAIRKIARSFAEAYLKGDAKGIKPYLGDEASNRKDVSAKNVFDDLDLFILKADFNDIEGKEQVEVQYQYNEKGADSSDYLGMVFSKKSGEWKIIDYFIEK